LHASFGGNAPIAVTLTPVMRSSVLLMTSIILDDIDHSFAANKLAPLPVTALSETLLAPLHGHHVVKQSKDSRNYPATPITPSNQNFAEIRAQLSVLGLIERSAVDFKLKFWPHTLLFSKAGPTVARSLPRIQDPTKREKEIRNISNCM